MERHDFAGQLADQQPYRSIGLYGAHCDDIYPSHL